MRCKGSHRAGIACFQFGKRVQITLRRGVFVLCIPKRFECTQSLDPTPQNKVADRSASELFHLAASVALAHMRVPSCLLAASSRAATLMVSP